MSEEVLSYINQHREQLLQRLQAFLTIPSVSTDSSYKQDVQEVAQFVQHFLNEIGFENVIEIKTSNHPIVYAEYNDAGPDSPTVLFYGHYDVQPVDPIEEWKSEPFTPEIRDGRIYARGASDDKGQVFMHLAVFEAFMKTKGALPVNVKVCIEGEEEIGSENLYNILHEKQEKFQADFAVIRSEEHTSNSSHVAISYAVFCLKKK